MSYNIKLSGFLRISKYLRKSKFSRISKSRIMFFKKKHTQILIKKIVDVIISFSKKKINFANEYTSFPTFSTILRVSKFSNSMILSRLIPTIEFPTFSSFHTSLISRILSFKFHYFERNISF